MLDQLRRIAPLDPEHLPGEIALIEEFGRTIPDVPQVACFDTASTEGCRGPRRSCQSRGDTGDSASGGTGFTVCRTPTSWRNSPEPPDRRRPRACRPGAPRLGRRAAAVRQGRCLDTTMGSPRRPDWSWGPAPATLTPGSSPSSPTPSACPETFQRMVNQESGLLGVSETSRASAISSPGGRATSATAEAIDLFCYRVKSAIGALSAALGGLDSLVFSGGIGENSPKSAATSATGSGSSASTSTRIGTPPKRTVDLGGREPDQGPGHTDRRRGHDRSGDDPPGPCVLVRCEAERFPWGHVPRSRPMETTLTAESPPKQPPPRATPGAGRLRRYRRRSSRKLDAYWRASNYLLGRADLPARQPAAERAFATYFPHISRPISPNYPSLGERQ